MYGRASQLIAYTNNTVVKMKIARPIRCRYQNRLRFALTLWANGRLGLRTVSALLTSEPAFVDGQTPPLDLYRDML